MPSGRYPKAVYTDELAAEICETVATSIHGLKLLCKKNKHWPNHKIITRWRYDPTLPFGDLYAKAKQSQMDYLVDRIFVLTRNKESGYLINKEGNKVADGTFIQKMRSEIDAIKWLTGKLSPRVYGQKNDDKANSQDAISEFNVE